MRIEVVVSGWEQHCCGKAFTRGTPATVSIVALDPSQKAPDAPARFLEEHHGQTPADVPQWDVTGTVARITGVSYEQRRRPGPHPVFERGDSIVSSSELDGVEARDTGGFGDLHLLIDLDDATALPSYVASEDRRVAAAERAAADQERARQRRADAVGVVLGSIADDAIAAYSSVARIERYSEGFTVAIMPHRSGTAGVAWTRPTSVDADGITVSLGEGKFAFPADVEHASELRELIAAAAAGRVHEKVHRGAESTVFATIVESADGRTWTAAINQPIQAGGIAWMSGHIATRLRAGDHGYEAWTA
ncbi:DUF6578 domain-containing protein [Agreia bicolorata]|uniref:Uncharacterized protein n=1 Tax=Agreia bicolorata TaxID=110935 RepID=A0ABR5CHC6_9MICO|nr:DUF6578 domain-containing protein [Agreia bicolorata]KJC65078.1 hypothetical protein TZ00_05835 [Agreia bicolorata]